MDQLGGDASGRQDARTPTRRKRRAIGERQQLTDLKSGHTLPVGKWTGLRGIAPSWRVLLKRIERFARRTNRGVIADVDDGGWPILIERMDHAALLAGVELAPGNARTAAWFKKPSRALDDAINGARVAATTARGER